MKTNKSLLASLALGALIFSSCEKDHAHVHNEHEVMTTLTYTLTAADADTVTLKFIDLDGEGGEDGTTIGGTLKANTIYAGSIEILNETETPAEDVTIEILEEDEDHQFFFTTTEGLTVSYSDKDENGNPIGQLNSLTTGGEGAGTIMITLLHEPNKSGTGVAGGDMTEAGGERDIEVIFPVNVE
ncbi:type 1 periplasmic binding fold superfamily protein [Flavobacteriales bacterium]|nr:type 1 periplasmic binding fold superfamily protein [Flavobacteriales bacterium]